MHILSIAVMLACLTLAVSIIWMALAPNFGKIAAALAGENYGQALPPLTAPRRVRGVRPTGHPVKAQRLPLAA